MKKILILVVLISVIGAVVFLVLKKNQDSKKIEKSATMNISLDSPLYTPTNSEKVYPLIKGISENAPQYPGIFFDINKIHLGDMLDGLKVGAINFKKCGQPEKLCSATVEFSGKVIVSGWYYFEPEICGCNMLSINEESSRRIPALIGFPGYDLPLWVRNFNVGHLSNNDNNLLNFKQGGFATVELIYLENYTNYLGGHDVSPIARIGSVIKDEPLK